MAARILNGVLSQSFASNPGFLKWWERKIITKFYSGYDPSDSACMILSALWTNKPSRMDSVLDMWIDPRRRAQNYFCMKLCAGGVQHRRDVKPLCKVQVRDDITRHRRSPCLWRHCVFVSRKCPARSLGLSVCTATFTAYILWVF